MEKGILLDRVRGALFGFAIGDAMGATTEFMSEVSIYAQYGILKDIIGGGWLKLKPGSVTDDTQMSLGVISALMKCGTDNPGLFKKVCMDNFADWYLSNPPDVGNQCAKAISYYTLSGMFISPDEDALGNGSLMRALPCALAGNVGLNLIQGDLTHNNKTCRMAIKSYTESIENLVYSEERRWMSYSDKLMVPSGYIINTLNNAYYWSNKETFEECIIGAVNHGGDSDTIAAIAGGLSGARFGISCIPERWLKSLNKDVTEALDVFANWVVKMHFKEN